MKVKQNMRKALVLSLMLTLGALTAFAQDNYNGSRGLFGRGPGSGDLDYGNRDALINYNINDNTGSGITNNNFGSPLGSGIAILIGAGLGYMVLKKKEDKQ